MNPSKNNDFDRQVAGKFENFRPEVPSGLWDKIASKLDEQEQSSIVPIKQRRFPTWWITVAATVLMVCGIVYWYNRPVEVTYLQNPVVHEEEAGTPAVEEPTPAQVPSVEPLDIDRLKQLFAKRNRKVENETRQETQIAGTQHVNRPVEATNNQPAITEAVPPTSVLANNTELITPPSMDRTATGEEIAATVPDIQPPVVLEEEEDVLLAATEEPKQPFGISNILNYVVGTVDQRDEKLVTFSNDSEGSLKLDFNFGLARNKKKRIK